MTRMKKGLIGLILLSVIPASARERPRLSALGPEFEVNSQAAEDQGSPCIGMNPAGDFVLVWTSTGQDGDGMGVFGKRYDKQGKEREVPSGIEGSGEGNEFQVNSYTVGGQSMPNVAMDHQGNFVVLWHSLGQDGSRNRIFAKRYDAAGREVSPPTELRGKGEGNEFQVNAEIRGEQSHPSVAMGPDGTFFVAWLGRVFPRNQGGIQTILAQRYDPSGARLGREFVVARVARIYSIALAGGSDGSFLLSWDGEGEHVWAKGYDLQGQEIDPPWGLPGKNGDSVFQVSSYTGTHGVGPYNNPHGAAIDPRGGSVIVFGSRRQDGDGNGLFAKRYDRKGNEISANKDTRGAGVGNEFQVNTYVRGMQGGGSAAISGEGHFVIVWMSIGQDGDHQGVFAKVYDREGHEIPPPPDLRGAGVGNEFQVNTISEGAQGYPDVAIDENGDLVIAWTGSTDGDKRGIFARRYSLR